MTVYPARSRKLGSTFAAKRAKFRLRSKTKATVGVPTIFAPSTLRLLSTRATLAAPCPLPPPFLPFSSRERNNRKRRNVGGTFNACQKETDVSIRVHRTFLYSRAGRGNREIEGCTGGKTVGNERT